MQVLQPKDYRSVHVLSFLPEGGFVKGLMKAVNVMVLSTVCSQAALARIPLYLSGSPRPDLILG